MFSYVSPTFAYLIAGTTKFNTSVVLIFILTVSSIIDVWVTPIPFRVFYILHAIIMNLIIACLASTFNGTLPFSSQRFSPKDQFLTTALFTLKCCDTVGFAAAQVRSGLNFDGICFMEFGQDAD